MHLTGVDRRRVTTATGNDRFELPPRRTASSAFLKSRGSLLPRSRKRGRYDTMCESRFRDVVVSVRDDLARENFIGRATIRYKRFGRINWRSFLNNTHRGTRL